MNKIIGTGSGLFGTPSYFFLLGVLLRLLPDLSLLLSVLSPQKVRFSRRVQLHLRQQTVLLGVISVEILENMDGNGHRSLSPFLLPVTGVLYSSKEDK